MDICFAGAVTTVRECLLRGVFICRARGRPPLTACASLRLPPHQDCHTGPRSSA
ncbi:proline-rich receptor-like protein kinase PERK2 [Iris pallida]|uniref:Proline-rich receptor-like protein kinase PERK2 n=1 Tax=Iris pallida TaxID=29817 RepID=A0AAX6GZA3_IRIPA|nr:proline-rich receptor-like protein kinase PERK2 [Iris pallida]